MWVATKVRRTKSDKGERKCEIMSATTTIGEGEYKGSGWREKEETNEDEAKREREGEMKVGIVVQYTIIMLVYDNR